MNEKYDWKIADLTERLREQSKKNDKLVAKQNMMRDEPSNKNKKKRRSDSGDYTHRKEVSDLE